MSNDVQFYQWTQHDAVAQLPRVLEQHLPYSNALYNRIIAPQNTPERRCVFAATFAVTDAVPETFTVFFSDRNRKSESQVWVYNSLQSTPYPDKDVLRAHTLSLLRFIQSLEIPDAPGWPFDSILRFAMLHDCVYNAMEDFIKPGLKYSSVWKAYMIKLDVSRPAPLEGFTLCRVPDDQLDVVLATSTIPRQASTMKALPSAALLDAGRLVAWAYIGIDGSFATLYTIPEYRRQGLGTHVVKQLLAQLKACEFADIGFHGASGWTQSDVSETNVQSQGVMSKLGGTSDWRTVYCRVDLDQISHSNF